MQSRVLNSFTFSSQAELGTELGIYLSATHRDAVFDDLKDNFIEDFEGMCLSGTLMAYS